MGTSAMGHRIVFLAAVLFAAALAAALDARAEDQGADSRTLSIRLPGRALLPPGGWRVPLRESMFLSLEATFSHRFDPAHPALARAAFQAGIAVGVAF